LIFDVLFVHGIAIFGGAEVGEAGAGDEAVGGIDVGEGWEEFPIGLIVVDGIIFEGFTGAGGLKDHGYGEAGAEGFHDDVVVGGGAEEMEVGLHDESDAAFEAFLELDDAGGHGGLREGWEGETFYPCGVVSP
jgi:hypothetical protein